MNNVFNINIIIYVCVSGVKIFGGSRASSSLNIPEAHSLHHEYSSLACTVEVVDDVNAAIDHIHQYGRHVDFLNIANHLCFYLFRTTVASEY